MGLHRSIWRRAASLLPIGRASLWMSVCGCGGDAGTVTPPVVEEETGSPKVVTRVSITPSESIIGMLAVTVDFGAVALAANDSVVYDWRNGPERFSWSTSDPKVATVEGGAVTSVGEGTAAITATVEGITGSMTVTVEDRARFAWSVRIPGGIDAGNVVGADGTIYVGNDDAAANGSTWYAISPRGNIAWTLDLPRTPDQIPAIGADGTLYLVSTALPQPIQSRLIAVDPRGTVRWMLGGLEEIRSSPAVAPDGTVYVAGGTHVYAVDPQGEIRWTYESPAHAFLLSSPAIARDGTIYVGGDDGRLHAIHPDGALRWTFRSGDLIRSSPSIGKDGTIYFGASYGGRGHPPPGRLYAVHPDGTERWSVALPCSGFCTSVESTPSIGADGTIYVQARGLFAIDPDGSIRWSYPGVGANWNTAILGADGTIYVADVHPGIHVFDARGRRLWDYPKAGAPRLFVAGLGSPTIGLDGSIIMVAGDELIAVVEHSPTNGGYAAAPWPQVRGKRANSGRAGG